MGTLGTSSTTSVRSPATSAERNAEPIPKATTSARVDAGRAMSGRIGISLASTVSSVIDVPATHSSGVNVICPDWTEAISSSVEANKSPPRPWMYASFGWMTTPGTNGTAATTRATISPAVAMVRLGHPAAKREGDPEQRVDQREQDDHHRRAEQRDQQERDDHAGGDGTDRVDRDERPGFAPRVPSVVGQQRGRGREAEAQHDGDRQDDEDRVAGQGTEGEQGIAGVQRLGPDHDPDESDHDQGSDQDLRHREEPDRVAHPRTDVVEQERPDGQPDEEDARG